MFKHPYWLAFCTFYSGSDFSLKKYELPQDPEYKIQLSSVA
jgi:hypothetical protein